EDDDEHHDIMARINDVHTEKTITAERAFLNRIEGGCQNPIGGYAYLESDDIILSAMVGSPDGQTISQEVVRGNDPVQVGEQAAQNLLDQGAKDIDDQAKEKLYE